MAFTTDTYVIKGMRQDDSDLLFNGNKEGLTFAFENLNMRFTTDTETTSLVATQEKGNTQCTIKVSPHFFVDINNISGSFYDITKLPFRVIGHCEVDKYLVLFGKCVATTAITNHDEQRLTFTEGNDVIVRLERQNDVFYGWLIYNSNELNFDLNWPLETLGNVETNLVKKVYFVDGINIPRAVNVVNKDAGELTNINLGYSLKYPDVFNVIKDYSVVGNYPMGKVRFFFTYLNDNYSETNIIDWSPFFDCNLVNQGGAADSSDTTRFSFKITLNGTDSQFKFVRIYMQHFTSNDTLVYKLKYIERPRLDNMVVNFDFDEFDAKDYEGTYLDKKITIGSIIPLTLSEKNNRLFYGNIKRGMPDVKDIDLQGTASIKFKLKQIGSEKHRTYNTVYQYQSNETTFKGSTYDYMGFRKDNWYRFGLIAQYHTGEWSDVLFIADARCDISSKTEIHYIGGMAVSNNPILHTDISLLDTERPVKIPYESVYYIPQAYLEITNNTTERSRFYNALQELKRRGFVRIKPVCVVPPPGYRDVITQGLSCSSLYVGKERSTIHNNGLFAMPSWFFRPIPLYPNRLKLAYPNIENDNTVIPDYAYTIRNIKDLSDLKNILSDGNWKLNPTFDDDVYMRFNPVFREWRHGFSLPPKDRINAELQSSDFSIHDRYYISPTTHKPSKLFTDVDLYAFIEDKVIEDCLFKSRNDQIVIDFSNDNWPEKMVQKYEVLPYHSVYTTGYDNTVFIDESILTLNSPEIDYKYSSLVAPYFKDCDIEVVGYAQVTSSAVDIDIPNKKLEISKDNATNVDSDNENIVTGQCLFSLLDGDSLDQNTRSFIQSLTSNYDRNQPMSCVCGPWWFDTMLVNSYRKWVSDYLRTQATIEGILGLVPNAIVSNFSAHELDDFLFGINSQNYEISFTADGTTYKLNVKDNSLYNVYDDDDNITVDLDKKNSHWYARGLDYRFTDNQIRFNWTSSFYGETNKFYMKQKPKYTVMNYGNSPYPHTGKHDDGTIVYGKHIVIFSEFPYYEHYEALSHGADIAPDKFEELIAKWATIPCTWNTVGLTLEPFDGSDTYWQKFLRNRTTLDRSVFSDNYNGRGTLTLPRVSHPLVGDLRNNIIQSDIRGLFSYYFFPYYDSNKALSFYKDGSLWRKVGHPWLLPSNTRHNWLTLSPTVFANMANINGCETPALNGTNIPYFSEGSEYGCHYYAPFSTNFCGGYFEPYYAHVVYPFMTTMPKMPFCGSYDVYVDGRDSDTVGRPSYNSTHSLLYSNCTNYLTDTCRGNNSGTYSDYYCSPTLTQILSSEPDLKHIPFIKNSNRLYPYIYSLGYNVNVEGNYPIIQHRTQTLTAAMKWYRGFKVLASNQDLVRQSDETSELISPGLYVDKPAIAGNLLFSGWMPQFFTKNGMLHGNTGLQLQNFRYVAEGVKHQSDNEKFHYNNYLRNFMSISQHLLELKYYPTPHVVYCKQPDDNTLSLLDKIVALGSESQQNLFSGNYLFKPQFYYKEFVNEEIPLPFSETCPNSTPLSVFEAAQWYYSTYPHTGHFEPYEFESLQFASQPYWNKDNNLSAYPSDVQETNLEIEVTDENMVRYDLSGYAREANNYWLLPISNIYNSKLIAKYSRNNKNPYTWENYSVEQWDWKMCGDTVTIDNMLDDPDVTLNYLEGDTYFQRYNCLKTVSNDTITTYLDGSNDESSVYGNDVTEAASVMLESYINVDGIYWEYRSLLDNKTSPLLHPLYNHLNQINNVYTTQSDICDVFKQIDYNYYNAELTHYPTEIMWSLQKQDGENIDSWGIIPATNQMLVSGEMGSVNKLLSFNNNLFCLQDHALSILNYNPQVISPTNTDSTLTVYLSDSTKLQDVTYISRNVGTLNKWSVALSQQGFYWIDDTLKQICGYLKQDKAHYGIVDMSSNYGFKSWSNANILSDNCVWNINTFPSENNAFKANYDLKNHDVYWANGDCCICYNELLDCFTSFYNYEKIPYKFNYLDECYSICNNTPSKFDTLWHDYSNYTHSLYGNVVDSYIELLVNPSGQYDKVFNFIEYATEQYDTQYPFDVAFPEKNPYNYIRVNNTYQIGFNELNKSNTQNRFKLWRTTLPREYKNGKHTMNRIRSPWCKIKLERLGSLTDNNVFRDKLHYINVNYTIPEQPLKTNIRS